MAIGCVRNLGGGDSSPNTTVLIDGSTVNCELVATSGHSFSIDTTNERVRVTRTASSISSSSGVFVYSFDITNYSTALIQATNNQRVLTLQIGNKSVYLPSGTKATANLDVSDLTGYVDIRLYIYGDPGNADIYKFWLEK